MGGVYLNSGSPWAVDEGFDAGRSGRPFFSIVMPAYGVRDYIADAIDCIQAQSFSDWELVVVDDCSVDGSGEIARSYAATDDRIRVVRHGENKGLSEARNTGIVESRGIYLWIPDPDDLYDSNLLADAYSAMRENSCNPDVVMFGHAEDYYDSEGHFLYANEKPMTSAFFSCQDDWRKKVVDFEKGTHYGYAWNKLYLLDRVKSLGLRYESVRLIEDVLFNVSYFQDLVSLVVLSGVPYRYAKRRGKSLTNANAYSSKEYYELHRRRIAVLKGQLEGWGVFDLRSKAILGGLYGRYVLSALERSWHPGGAGSLRRRFEYCKLLCSDPLFVELIPSAKADSFPLRFCLGVLGTRKAALCVSMGGLICFAREHCYPLFTRLRSER